jgi:hypothetical protein
MILAEKLARPKGRVVCRREIFTIRLCVWIWLFAIGHIFEAAEKGVKLFFKA